MNRDLLRDWADNLIAEHPETSDPVSIHPEYYRGTGNLCQQLAISMGTSREERLRRIAWLLNCNLTTMKDLSVAQLRALYTFRDHLKDFHA